MHPNRKIDWRFFTLALLVALLVRGSVLVTMGSSLADDPDAYRQIAVSLEKSGVFGLNGVPTAYRPPLYPTALRIFGYDPPAVAILHLATGLITVAGTFLLCCRVGLARWAFFAAMLVTFDPILLNQSTQVMTETTATMLVVVAMFGLVNLIDRPTVGRAILAGIALGVTGLCRPELLAWVGLCVVTLPFLLRNRKPVSRLTSEANQNTSHTRWLTVVTLLFLALTLMPWITRNYKVFGRPIPATTHGGYTLLLANNPPFYAYLRSGEWGSTWDADELGPRWAGHAKFASPAEELQTDRDAYREAWSNIRRQPGMFFYSCLVRAGRLWGLIPHQGPTVARYAIGVWYLALYILAILGTWTIWRKRRELATSGRAIWLWGGILVASTTAVHTIFWSNMRMRAPLIPILALVATAGLASRLSNRQQQSNPSSKDEV